MSKKFIWILSILMTVTMFWFIYIQIKWIDGAMEVRERQFVSLVNTSLRIIANEIVEKEVVSHVTSEAFSFDVDSLKDLTHTDNKNDKHYYDIDNNTVFIENVVNEIVRRKINIKDRLDKEILEKKIETVFKRHNVNFDYEFAVITENGNFHFKSINFNLDKTDEVFEVELYPNDLLYKEKHYLKVYFPHEKEDIFFTLPKVALSTLFLIMAIMTIFFITIHIIMRQKKIVGNEK